MAGLYIHIPYCRQACHYCSFHFSTTLKSKAELVQALCWEMEQRHHFLENEKLHSIYLGGGTPSILTEEEIEFLFIRINKLFQLQPSCEVTLECNPEDIDSNKLIHWFDLGVNRLSVGLQSFRDDDLSYMNRAHNSGQSYRALEYVAQSDFTNVTADLMFGLIDSDLKKWKFNLDEILKFDLPHLSIYNLTIEEQTAFANWKNKQKLSEAPESSQEDQFYMASEILCQNGHDHYEISNYAKQGFQAVHNTNYWNRITYLGIGPSAHSFNGKLRIWNISNNNKYLKNWKDSKIDLREESLTETDQYNEMIMLGLRTKKGINLGTIKNFPRDIQEYFNREIQSYLDDHTLHTANNHVKLHTNKWYLSDHISSELFYTATT